MAVFLRLGLRCLLWGGGLWAVRTFGPRLFPLVAPFALALLPVWWLNPAVTRLSRRAGGPRGLWAVLLPGAFLALVLAGLALLGRWLAAELGDALEHWPLLAEQLEALWERGRRLSDPAGSGGFPLLEQSLSRLLLQLRTAVPDLLGRWLARLGGWAMALPSLAVGVLVFFLACCFLLADYPRVARLWVRAAGPETAGLFRFVGRTAAGALGGWLRAQLLLSAGIFCLLLLGFSLLRLSYVLLPALLLTLVDLLPLLGAGTVLLPWAGLCLLTGDPRRGVGLLLLWGVTALFRRGAEPRLVGRQTGLSPILTLLGIYAGMKLAGVAGMILGPTVLLIGLELGRAGVFDGLRADLRQARAGLRRFLRPPSP